MNYQNDNSTQTISFTIALKNKIHRNKLTKDVKDLYSENHKTVMKEIEGIYSMFLDWKN